MNLSHYHGVRVARRTSAALTSLLLLVAMVAASCMTPSRGRVEEEVETIHCSLIFARPAPRTSVLVRLPIIVAVRPQGRAIDRGVHTRHGNNEQSKRNGTGSYLII